MKTVLKIIFLVTFAGLVGACTTMEHMKWFGVGGSKADGVVILGFDVPPKMGVRETEPGAPEGRCAIKPRSAPELYVRRLEICNVSGYDSA